MRFSTSQDLSHSSKRRWRIESSCKPLSSAGLVYLHFGQAIIVQYLSISEDTPEVNIIFNKIYENFIEALDAYNSGVLVYDLKNITVASLEKKFNDGRFSLSAMQEDEKFLAASKRIGEEFSRDLDYYTKSWLLARGIVRAAYAKRRGYGSEGRILVFDSQSVPWKDYLYTLEDEDKGQAKVVYVLYPEKPVPDAKWRIQCVPVSKDSFESRKPLPDAWKGFRDEKLDEICGVEGRVFVHAAGFIGGNKTFDGAKIMAQKAQGN
ncbi:hypothetical protein B7463_g6839, partial [Scytalidium lignicola]